MADIRAALQIVPPSLWNETGQPTVPRWLPLILVSQTGLWIGLEENGHWVVGRPGGRTDTTVYGVTPAWLPLLDLDPAACVAEIADAAQRHAFPPDVLSDNLPIDDTITLALASNSQHWIERAVVWLSARRPAPEQIPLLAAIADAKWVDQRTRHEARRLASALGG